ncbi:MAG: class I SAM-dependent methyltransferase, partial [Deltaproteobacteria bacterium]|nr:class I SAM-dependent methyltransferase [Deltaproteobacteria bacterium]
MTEPSPRFWELFFELFESLPRQGPGNRSCTERALAICVELPNSPDIVDLGCGSGAGSLHLAELTRGSIVAIDSHGRSIERLQQIAKDRGLEDRIRAQVGDMSSLDLPDQSFDLVWSEGALYNLGLDAGLGLCRRLLRPGGYLAFTDAVWLASDPPAEVRAAFEADYPTMGTVDTV